jgi:hypothetical protein
LGVKGSLLQMYVESYIVRFCSSVKVDEYAIDGHAVCMEELVIVHDRLDRKFVEKCQFSAVCVEGRINFEDVAQAHWRDCLELYGKDVQHGRQKV